MDNCLGLLLVYGFTMFLEGSLALCLVLLCGYGFYNVFGSGRREARGACLRALALASSLAEVVYNRGSLVSVSHRYRYLIGIGSGIA